jgi:hypothetical protein
MTRRQTDSPVKPQSHRDGSARVTAIPEERRVAVNRHSPHWTEGTTKLTFNVPIVIESDSTVTLRNAPWSG